MKISHTYPTRPSCWTIGISRADELGTWGFEWLDGELYGLYRQPARSQICGLLADPLPTTLDVVADSGSLKARERDTTRVIIRALDQYGQRLAFLHDSVTLRVDGPAKIVGPSTIPLQGGTAGFWLEATGLTGNITVEAVSSRFAPVTLHVTAV